MAEISAKLLKKQEYLRLIQQKSDTKKETKETKENKETKETKEANETKQTLETQEDMIEEDKDDDY